MIGGDHDREEVAKRALRLESDGMEELRMQNGHEHIAGPYFFQSSRNAQRMLGELSASSRAVPGGCLSERCPV